MAALTSRQIAAMLKDTESIPVTENSERADLACHIKALAAEIDRLAEQLAECWLFMERFIVPPDIPMGISGEIARRLLRKHQAPGHKV